MGEINLKCKRSKRAYRMFWDCEMKKNNNKNFQMDIVKLNHNGCRSKNINQDYFDYVYEGYYDLNYYEYDSRM